MPKPTQKIYSVLETSKILGISVRGVQKRCKVAKLKKSKNRYIITDETLRNWSEKSEGKNNENAQYTNERTSTRIEILELIKSISNDDYIKTVLEAINQGQHLEEFSENEYIRFNDRLKEANSLEVRIAEYKEELKRIEEYVQDYRNTIQYLRVSLDKRANESVKLIESIRERNFIEAKDKKLD